MGIKYVSKKKKPETEAPPVKTKKPKKQPKAKALVSKQGTATMTTQHPNGSTTEQKQTLSDPDGAMVQAGEYASVSVNLAQTINLGSYNSAKVGVILTMPCGVEEIDAVFDFTKKWVEDRMGALVEEVIGAKESAQEKQYKA